MKPYASFVTDLGARESAGSGGYTAKNQFGFLGRYQFGLARLCDLGLTVRRKDGPGFAWRQPYSEAGFLADSALQDRCFDVHVCLLRQVVLHTHPKALGRTYCGVQLSLSGAIACCHLLGPGGLNSLVMNIDRVDANGTRATEYAAKFGGYDIPGDLPSRVQQGGLT